MSQQITYLVLIFLHQDQASVLRQYEQQAVRIMRRHGGGFERVLRPAGRRGVGATPDEVHLLSFPSDDHFRRFRADPELEQYRSLREAAVRAATVLPLVDVPLDDYLASS